MEYFDQYDSIQRIIVHNLTPQQHMVQGITDESRCKNPYNKLAWYDLEKKNKPMIE